MKTFTREVLIPTGQYANEKVVVSMTFDDEVKNVEAWFKIDEAVDFKKNMIDKEVEMNATFATTPKMPPTPVATAPAYIPTAQPVNVAPSATTGAKMCPIHNVPLENKVSKTSGKPYTGHFLSPGKMCFGKPSGYSI
jgi:hypothetical protein